MTDNEIIKASECCHKCITAGSMDKDCPNCPLYNVDGCCDMLIVALADFVKRLQAEKEALIKGQETLQKHIVKLNELVGDNK